MMITAIKYLRNKVDTTFVASLFTARERIITYIVHQRPLPVELHPKWNTNTALLSSLWVVNEANQLNHK